MSYKRVVVGGRAYYGLQLSVSASGCTEHLQDQRFVAEFLSLLPGKIGMQAYGNPVVARFGEGDEIGLSGVQLIETSAIVLHTNDEAGDLYLDVFSCKEFDPEIVIEEVRYAFAPAYLTFSVALRP